MSSIGGKKDDETGAARDLNIAFCVLYGCFFMYSALQLYRKFNHSYVLRIIHSLILLFLLLRIFFWLDIVLNYDDGSYFILQSFPNFILYNIGQVICYTW
mmetsp:Transcript_18412/g.33139  ORF Transcript_18412/g.33139 Transcript_18412/m.33139 type:complete len:100 (-) Transcript_18412:1410-1709(-)